MRACSEDKPSNPYSGRRPAGQQANQVSQVVGLRDRVAITQTNPYISSQHPYAGSGEVLHASALPIIAVAVTSPTAPAAGGPGGRRIMSKVAGCEI